MESFAAPTSSMNTSGIADAEKTAVDHVAREQVRTLGLDVHAFRKETGEKLKGLEHNLMAGFEKIYSTINSDVRTSLHESKNSVSALAKFSLGVITVAFAFTHLVTEPLRSESAIHNDRLKMLEQRQFDALLKHEDTLEKIHATANRNAYLEGLLHAKQKTEYEP